jgi:hypothetical protein
MMDKKNKKKKTQLLGKDGRLEASSMNERSQDTKKQTVF